MEGFLEGHSTTIFAYGQTGAGKTFSVIGGKTNSRNSSSFTIQSSSHLSRHKDRGILPRFFDAIYDRCDDAPVV